MPAASVLPVSSRRAAAATVAPHARGGMRLLILAVLVLLAAAVALSHEAMSYRTLTIRLERAVEEAEATLQHVTVVREKWAVSPVFRVPATQCALPGVPQTLSAYVAQPLQEHANATASSDSASDPAAQQQVVQVRPSLCTASDACLPLVAACTNPPLAACRCKPNRIGQPLPATALDKRRHLQQRRLERWGPACQRAWSPPPAHLLGRTAFWATCPASSGTPAPPSLASQVVLNETHCLDTCCWRYEEVTWHYAGAVCAAPAPA